MEQNNKPGKINALLDTTLSKIRELVDSQTVIGEPISTQDGSTVVPISRVSFGFVAGGGDFARQGRTPLSGGEALPFAGGTGAGVTVSPLGFLVTNQDQVRLLPAQCYQPIDRIIELIPQAMGELRAALGRKE